MMNYSVRANSPQIANQIDYFPTDLAYPTMRVM